MPIADVLKRKNMSRASREDAPWKQWPDEMMKKTAIRVLSRLLPMSSDLDILIRRDEEALLGVEAVDDTRAALAERPSTQAALDHFAGDRQTADSPAEPEPDSGAPNESETDQEHPSTMSQSSSTGGAAAAEPPRDQPAAASFTDPIKAAEQRGRADRANGMSLKAVPPEFRTADKTALAAAWIKGWQGGAQ
jgi:recombination protein RecT